MRWTNMKIIKLIKINNHYYTMFNEIPEITYEKIGSDYVGSYVDSKGTVIFSRFLKRERFGDAFGGSELHLNMKDGTIQTIKDYWFDHGSYNQHGEFIGIGAGTLEELQRCYVYCGKNINKEAFNEMVEEYLTRDKLYDYREVEEWCKLQYEWFPVIIRGKKIPFMMNKYGDMAEKETKKRVYPRYNLCRNVKGKWKDYTYFKFAYKDGDRIIKIHDSYLKVLKATLPFVEEEIKVNCKLN